MSKSDHQILIEMREELRFINERLDQIVKALTSPVEFTSEQLDHMLISGMKQMQQRMVETGQPLHYTLKEPHDQ
jgi:hypothetical protein